MHTTTIGALWYPLAAVGLGFSLGVGLLLLTKRASRLLTPEDPVLGMAKVLATVFGGMASAVGMLALAYLFVPTALAPFGLALVAGFLLVAIIELLKFGGLTAVSWRRR